MKINIDEIMGIAIENAKIAMFNDEVPVGAVISDQEGNIIVYDYNRQRMNKDPSAHAEINVIRNACEKLGVHRLDGYFLFTSLEPCAMCAGAIAHARIKKLFIAAQDLKMGAVIEENIFAKKYIHHKIEIEYGFQSRKSASLLREFFAQKRNEKK